VLVVDDEPLLAQILGRLLSDAHRVDVTTSVRDALDRMVRGERYDIVFCDVLMGEMSGLDFLDEVVRHVPGQARRIVFFTGGVTDPALRARLDMAAAPVLEKPVDIRVMLRLVDEYQALSASPQAVASD
jgi:CheY-like chemotaxis protein